MFQMSVKHFLVIFSPQSGSVGYITNEHPRKAYSEDVTERLPELDTESH